MRAKRRAPVPDEITTTSALTRMQPPWRSHSTRSEEPPDEKRRTSSSVATLREREEVDEADEGRRKDCLSVKTSVSTLVPLGERRTCRQERGEIKESRNERLQLRKALGDK